MITECAFPACDCPGETPICEDYVCAGCFYGHHCNGFDESCSCPHQKDPASFTEEQADVIASTGA